VETQRVIDKQAYFNKIGYVPHAQQWLYHTSKARFRFPNCGRRFGKSKMAGTDLEPKLFLPDRNYWIIGPTYDLGEKEFRVIWNDLIVNQGLGRDKRIKRAYNKKQGNMFIEFPWGTNLIVRSADHPENLVGEALDWVIMSEAAKHQEETWQRFIRPSLADRRGGADFPTTPEGYNWLYNEWMYGQDPNMPEYDSWKFPSWANSVVYPGGEEDPEIVLLKKTMSPESFMQEIGADFGSFTGKIFPEWDVSLNVRRHEFRPDWPNYMTIDWGYTNPAAWIEFQISPQDEIFVWREHYQAFWTVDKHIAYLKNGRTNPKGYHLDMAFADAADPEAVAKVSQSFVPCWADPRAKSGSEEADGGRSVSGWREGIDLIRSFLERETGEDEFGGPIYEPAFFVDNDCINTIYEFNNYRAPEGHNGKNAPEGDNKSRNHATDAIRYGLMHKFKLGATYGLGDAMESYTNPESETYERFDESDLELVGSNVGGFDEGSGTEGYFTMGDRF